MLRVIAFVATLATTGIMAGAASAHPPDLHGSTYGTSIYGGGHTTSYVAPSYTGASYGASSYVAPSYTGASFGSTSYVSAPTYNATPLYSTTYSTPSYTPPRRHSYSGYRAPSYGYRHRNTGSYRGYYRNPYHNRPVNNFVRQSFGPYSRIPTTEGVNVGYAGGPTFGSDDMPVINGVRLNGAPN